jgi:hypothetical protein
MVSLSNHEPVEPWAACFFNSLLASKVNNPARADAYHI